MEELKNSSSFFFSEVVQCGWMDVRFEIRSLCALYWRRIGFPSTSSHMLPSASNLCVRGLSGKDDVSERCSV